MRDSALPDNALPDTALPDNRPADNSPADTPPPDSALPDNSPADTPLPDNSPADTPPPDSAPPDTGGQAPYGGTPWAVPGTIQAEDYDEGGEGVGYHDRSAGNAGEQYRDDDVDIWTTQDNGQTIFYTGGATTGEWLAYTVNVDATAEYEIRLRTTTPEGGRVVHLEVDRVDVTGPIFIPTTDAWQYWTLATTSAVLEQGEHELRVVFDVGTMSFDWIDIR